MTLATDIYWTGLHPATGEPVPVVRDLEEKRLQKALLRWGDPKNRPLLDKALRKTGRLRPGERFVPGSPRGRGRRGRTPPRSGR